MSETMTSEIKALENLRKFSSHEVLQHLIDAVQAEIDERFMELPVDADGVPIRVGEEMTCHGDVFTVCAVAPAKIHRWVTVKLGETQTTYSYDPMECTHYNPRTLEDVLKELACDVRKEWIENAPLAEHVYSEYADEIRELMKEGSDD